MLSLKSKIRQYCTRMNPLKRSSPATLWQAAFMTCLLTCGPMDAARAVLLPPVVDQQIIVPQQAAIAVTVGYSYGQSFTVGLAGSLTQIDFQLGRNAGTTQPLQVELRTA